MKSFHQFHFLSACNFYLKVSSSSDQKVQKSSQKKRNVPSSRISSVKIRRDARTGSGSTSLMASKYRKPRATGIKIPSNNSTQTSTLRRGLVFSGFCFLGGKRPNNNHTTGNLNSDGLSFFLGGRERPGRWKVEGEHGISSFQCRFLFSKAYFFPIGSFIIVHPM